LILSNAFQNRAPGTPLTEFYTLGKYPKSLEGKRRVSVAKPGIAATLVERNLRDSDTLNVKP